MKRSKKYLTFLFPLILLSITSVKIFGQDLSRKDQWKYLAPSLAVPLAESVFPYISFALPNTQRIMPYVSNSTQILSIIPLYWLNTPRALTYSGIELALPAVGLGLMFSSNNNDILPYIASNILFIYNRITKFNVYEVYKETRSRSTDMMYAQNFDHSSFWDLTKAPFSWRIISDPIVWLPAIASATAFLSVKIMNTSEYTPIWETGKTYLGQTELSPVLWGSLIAVGSSSTMSLNATGEEALYRGVIYEELKTATSPDAAKMFDMLFFPLIHVAGDINQGADTRSIDRKSVV